MPPPQPAETYLDGEIAYRLKKVHAKLPQVRDDCAFHLYCSPHQPGGAAQKMAEELQKSFLPTLLWTDDPAQLAECEHMVIMLTDETWTHGHESDLLAHEVCEAMRLGVHRLLVHEVPGARHGDNEARHATTFEKIIARTPKHLIRARLYYEIAMNLGGGEWRDAGLAKTAVQLAKGSGTREDWIVMVDEPNWHGERINKSAATESEDAHALPPAVPLPSPHKDEVAEAPQFLQDLTDRFKHMTEMVRFTKPSEAPAADLDA
jgi:hypothetical protein